MNLRFMKSEFDLTNLTLNIHINIF